jgi:hypothetical protein
MPQVTEENLFPYETFPVRLEFGEKKNLTVCHFQCDEHLQKYLERYKLDKRTIKVTYRDGEPAKSGKTNKKSVQSGTRKTSGRSPSGSKGDTKKLDSSGTTNRSRKSKK